MACNHLKVTHMPYHLRHSNKSKGLASFPKLHVLVRAAFLVPPIAPVAPLPPGINAWHEEFPNAPPHLDNQPGAQEASLWKCQRPASVKSRCPSKRQQPTSHVHSESRVLMQAECH